MAGIASLAATDPRLFQFDPLQIESSTRAMNTVGLTMFANELAIIAPDSAIAASTVSLTGFSLRSDGIGTSIDFFA